MSVVLKVRQNKQTNKKQLKHLKARPANGFHAVQTAMPCVCSGCQDSVLLKTDCSSLTWRMLTSGPLVLIYIGNCPACCLETCLKLFIFLFTNSTQCFHILNCINSEEPVIMSRMFKLLN